LADWQSASPETVDIAISPCSRMAAIAAASTKLGLISLSPSAAKFDTLEGFARTEWIKGRHDANEALDLSCYCRAAFELVKGRSEQLQRDVIRHFDPQSVEEIELPTGQLILVEKPKPRGREYRLGPQQRASAIIHLSGQPDPANIVWTGRKQPKAPSRYGAFGSSF